MNCLAEGFAFKVGAMAAELAVGVGLFVAIAFGYAGFVLWMTRK